MQPSAPTNDRDDYTTRATDDSASRRMVIPPCCRQYLAYKNQLRWVISYQSYHYSSTWHLHWRVMHRFKYICVCVKFYFWNSRFWEWHHLLCYILLSILLLLKIKLFFKNTASQELYGRSWQLPLYLLCPFVSVWWVFVRSFENLFSAFSISREPQIVKQLPSVTRSWMNETETLG